MRKAIFLIPFLFIASYCLADEQISGFDDKKDLPILNEELRKLDKANMDISDRVTILEATTSTIVIATQAQMEGATSNTVYVTPARTQYHPGVAKAMCTFDGTTVGTHSVTAGYNVDNVTRNNQGDYTVTFTTDFSNTNYYITGFAFKTGEQCYVTGTTDYAKAVGSVRFHVYSVGAGLTDATEVVLIAFGDQ